MLFVSAVQIGTAAGDDDERSGKELLRLGVAQKKNLTAKKRLPSLEAKMPTWAIRMGRVVGKLPALMGSYRGKVNGASAKLVRYFMSGITPGAAFNVSIGRPSECCCPSTLHVWGKMLTLIPSNIVYIFSSQNIDYVKKKT